MGAIQALQRLLGETGYHVLFNAEGSGVQECLIFAASIEDCEARLQEQHPEVVYWEIGVSDE